MLNGLYNDPRFIDQWTEGGRVGSGDETPLPQILPTLKSGVWTCDGIKCTPKISSLKCGVHGTWMMVIDDEGMYYPPILCLSRSKTADEKLGKKPKKSKNFYDMLDADELTAAIAQDEGASTHRGRPSEADRSPIWRKVPNYLVELLPKGTVIVWTPNGCSRNIGSNYLS